MNPKPETGQIWYMKGGLWDERWKILKIHKDGSWTVKIVWVDNRYYGGTPRKGNIVGIRSPAGIDLKLDKSFAVKKDLEKLLA